jgi:hypothetical protein
MQCPSPGLWRNPDAGRLARERRPHEFFADHDVRHPVQQSTEMEESRHEESNDSCLDIA